MQDLIVQVISQIVASFAPNSSWEPLARASAPTYAETGFPTVCPKVYCGAGGTDKKMKQFFHAIRIAVHPNTTPLGGNVLALASILTTLRAA